MVVDQGPVELGEFDDMSFGRGMPRVLPLVLAIAATAAIVAAEPLAAAPELLIGGSIQPMALIAPDPAPDGAAPRDDAAAPFTVRTFTVGKGDTVFALLMAAGSAPRDANAAIVALTARFDPRKLAVGQTITVLLKPGAGQWATLHAFSIKLGGDSYLVVERATGQRYVSRFTAAAPLADGASTVAGVPTVTLRARKGSSTSSLRSSRSRSSAMMSVQISMHSSQMYTLGPAISLRTSLWLLLQNEQRSDEFPELDRLMFDFLETGCAPAPSSARG